MADSSREIMVVGAGVSGLTTATHLAEHGFHVRVIAAAMPDATTSAIAGASWGPCLTGGDRVDDWCETTRLALEDIAEEEPASGVRLVSGLETGADNSGAPDWARRVRNFRECDLAELPDGYSSGWRYTLPLVDMPRYLAYLKARLARSHVALEKRRITQFDDVAKPGQTIVNCTGLGAIDLVPDDTIIPVRGQLVEVENPGIDWFFQDNAEGEDLTQILPHGHYVVLGGCSIKGGGSLDADPDIARRIIERCAQIVPSLANAKVLRHRVGMRPSRPEIRVERVPGRGEPIVHNYGHGGNGVTLSWGCAEEVRQLLSA